MASFPILKMCFIYLNQVVFAHLKVNNITN
jgi:hypothetical protein